MPVRFRCAACRGKLSISRRKIGSQVECPRCAQPITVPSADDFADEVTELLNAASRSLPSERASRVAVEQKSEPAPSLLEGDLELPAPAVMRMPATVPQTQKTAVPKAAPVAKPSVVRSLEEMPLFEQPELDKYLEESKLAEPPKKQRRSEADPQPLPTAAINDNATDAIVLTKAAASLLVVVVAAMIAMAFAIGYLIGAA